MNYIDLLYIVAPLLASPMALAGLSYPLTSNPRQLLRGNDIIDSISCILPVR